MELDDVRALMEKQLKLSRDLKARVRELESAARQPLAVVGTALRLPGGLNTPQDYWDFLLGDGDAIGPVPDGRTGLRAAYQPKPGPGTSYVDRGGFLDGVEEFDPAFFGMTPREADALDPQQRLLLETAWEAMERAGIPVRRQDRLDAGVFVGLMTADYTDRLGADRAAIDPYYGTGGGHAMAAGRIAYTMGLSGPAFSVDTACSSSLVALHQAAASLRHGECRYALVGGANIFFSADLMISLCQSRALAPDGRSKAFLDSADGYGRGEGVGALVLMRLSDAEAEGRPVLAVVRGSAVNHDGASSGLTVPNGPAQQEVLRAALADAGVAPHEVGYVEAHGTGTALGDPIEAGALDAVLGSGAPGREGRLAIGSVKSRIGHLESAAGMAALLKVVLMLRHGVIPASAPESDGPLNHLIPWESSALTVPRAATGWAGERRIAGVSAFGMSGTNAHVVLEAYTPAERPAHVTAPATELVTVSARHPESLAALARETADRLIGLPADRLADVCATLRDGRAAFEHRLAVTGRTPERLAEALLSASAGHTAPTERSAPTGIRLRFGGNAAVLEKALAVLRGSLPGLTPADVDPEPGDRTALRLLLRRFGVRATEDGTPAGTPGAVAELAWDGGTATLLTADADSAPETLREALAQLFRAGADLRFAPLRAPGTRVAGDLPTYAFRRRTHWVPEPLAGVVAVAPSAPDTSPDGPDASGEVAAITAFLAAELRRVTRAEEDADPALTFLDAGGDSFTAMQLTVAMEDRYGVEIPVDEFVVDLTLGELFERLGTYIARALREEAAA